MLAPTGTIGFMMDCDTTGVEPDIALVKYKKLVGGGMMKIVNQTVPMALQKLGYTQQQIKEIIEYIDENETIEGAPHIKDEHLPVFDCAFKPPTATRSIHYMGHLRMMAAVQPFLSGAISKTVNMPNAVSVDEIMQTYLEAWKLGLKAVAIYRDNSKRLQPVTVSKTPARRRRTRPRPARLPWPRRAATACRTRARAITHKFSIGGHEGYLTVGLYDDGKPGEIFITMAKEGSVVSGLMDSFATSVSIMLQYGVPLKVLINKFSHARFEPSGFTTNPEIPVAKSIMDYIFHHRPTNSMERDRGKGLPTTRQERIPAGSFCSWSFVGKLRIIPRNQYFPDGALEDKGRNHAWEDKQNARRSDPGRTFSGNTVCRVWRGPGPASP